MNIFYPAGSSVPTFDSADFADGSFLYIAPAIADWDGDQRLDVAVGRFSPKLTGFKNNPSPSGAVYTKLTGSADPFASLPDSSYSAPALADLDGDGDVDLVWGDAGGRVDYYRNTGSTTAPAFTLIAGPGAPLNGVNVIQISVPTLGDIDGDSDLDLLVGTANIGLVFLRNTGTATSPKFEEVTDASNPFAGLVNASRGNFVRADRDSTLGPALVDLDTDGDLDLVLGNTTSSVRVFENTGSIAVPSFIELTGADNPLASLRAGNARFATADLDGDGDADLIHGGGAYQPSILLANRAPLPRGDAVSTAESTPVEGNLMHAYPDFPDRDPDGDPLEVTQVNGSAANVGTEIALGEGRLTVQANGGFKFDPNGQYEALPAGATATETFTYTLSDSHGGIASTSVTLTITGANDAPTLAAHQTTLPATNEDATSATVSVSSLLSSSNWADADSGALQGIAVMTAVGAGSWQYNTGGSDWTPVGNPFGSASLLLDAGASLRFVPDGKNGSSAGFVYRAWDQTTGTASSDGTPRTADATSAGGTRAFSEQLNAVSLTVTSLNDAPTTSPVTLTPVNEDTPLTITQAMLLATANDVDRPAQTLTVSGVQLGAGLGSVVSAGPGAWLFTPAPNDDTQVSFSYTIGDGSATVAGSAKLDLLPVNDPPVAVADSAQTPQATAVTIAVLANDTDVDGGPLTVSAITQGSNGSVAIRADGVSVRYTPNAGFAGFDTFTYTANDGAGGTAVGTVRVLVPSFIGTSGNDVPLGTANADFILAGDGNDRVLTYGGADYVEGGRGADTLSGGLGADTLIGGDGADTFLTTAAELAGDSIDGGDAIDTLQITDPIAVMPAVFTLVNVEQLSYPGSLQVGHTALLDLSALTLSGAGNQINGGTAASRITGTRSNDRITDSAGNDDLRGGDGNDTIMAGVGQDTVYGGRGNDTLGGSSSTLGDGSVDTFVFNTALNALGNVDTIIGFEANGLDIIALDSGIFAAIGGTLDAGEFLAVAGGVAVDANDFIVYDTATGALYYDADGSGAGARTWFATLGAGLTGTVDVSDFAFGSYPG